MSIYDDYETSEELENKGAEVKLKPNSDGSIPTFIIAAAVRTNQKFASAVEKATRPFKRSTNSLDSKTAEAIYLKVFLDTVLKGWKNIQDKNGADIPYTRENAEKLFKQLPRLYDELNARAAEVDTFKEEVREEDAKN